MNTRISIQSPCNADWASMTGDERKRFCGECRKHVHDLSSMSPAEADALVRDAKGRLCVRFQPDVSGGVVHRSRSRRARLARWGLAALASLTAAPALASGRVDTSEGVGAWIAEVVSDLAGQVAEVVDPEPPMIMGEMAMETEPRALENRTSGPLVVDCGFGETTVEPGASSRLDAWPYEVCTVRSEGDTVQIDLDEAVCTRTPEGFTCAAPAAR